MNRVLRLMPPEVNSCEVLLVPGKRTWGSPIRRWLTRSSFKLSVAENVRAALEIANKEQPSVVLVDCIALGIPMVATFIDELRDLETVAKIIVMVRTDRELMFVQNLGTRWILQEPFAAEQLIATIDTAVAGVAARNCISRSAGTRTTRFRPRIARKASMAGAALL